MDAMNSILRFGLIPFLKFYHFILMYQCIVSLPHSIRPSPPKRSLSANLIATSSGKSSNKRQSSTSSDAKVTTWTATAHHSPKCHNTVKRTSYDFDVEEGETQGWREESSSQRWMCGKEAKTLHWHIMPAQNWHHWSRFPPYTTQTRDGLRLQSTPGFYVCLEPARRCVESA